MYTVYSMSQQIRLRLLQSHFKINKENFFVTAVATYSQNLFLSQIYSRLYSPNEKNGTKMKITIFLNVPTELKLASYEAKLNILVVPL